MINEMSIEELRLRFSRLSDCSPEIQDKEADMLAVAVQNGNLNAQQVARMLDDEFLKLVKKCGEDSPEQRPTTKKSIRAVRAILLRVNLGRPSAFRELDPQSRFPQWVQKVLVEHILTAMKDEILAMSENRKTRYEELVISVAMHSAAMRFQEQRSDFVDLLAHICKTTDCDYGGPNVSDRVLIEQRTRGCGNGKVTIKNREVVIERA